MTYSHGGSRQGSGRKQLELANKRCGFTIYINDQTKKQILKFGKGKSFSNKVVFIIESHIEKLKKEQNGK